MKEEIDDISLRPDRNTARQRWNRLQAMLHLRCPQCRRGLVFRTTVAMNNLCPVCGLKFEREPGYFTGAVYIGFALVAFFLGAVSFALNISFTEINFIWSFLIACALLLPLSPLLIRYSKIIWMTIDRTLDPGRGASRWGEPVRR